MELRVSTSTRIRRKHRRRRVLARSSRRGLLDRLLSKCTDKLGILAAPATLDRMYDFQETAFDALIDLLRASTPLIILDIPHVWNAWSRRMLVGADDVVIVSRRILPGFATRENLIDTLRASRPNDSRPKLILNMVGVPKRPEIAVADFAKALETDPVGAIPFEPKLFGTAANNGRCSRKSIPRVRLAKPLTR